MMVSVSLLSKIPQKHGKALTCSHHEILSSVGNGEQHFTEKTWLEENYNKLFLSYLHGKKLVIFLKKKKLQQKENDTLS